MTVEDTDQVDVLTKYTAFPESIKNCDGVEDMSEIHDGPPLGMLAFEHVVLDPFAVPLDIEEVVVLLMK